MQFYVQPLISSGIYSQYLSLRRARSYDFVSYGGPPLDADFDVGSLRGNAVLRWEYARGSVAYLVWQQERNGSDAAPAALSFTPSDFVLSCFQRIRGGVASGDRAVADTFRDLFFKV